MGAPCLLTDTLKNTDRSSFGKIKILRGEMLENCGEITKGFQVRLLFSHLTFFGLAQINNSNKLQDEISNVRAELATAALCAIAPERNKIDNLTAVSSRLENRVVQMEVADTVFTGRDCIVFWTLFV